MCKKLIFILPVLLLLFSVSVKADLVAHYPFDGDATDASGNGLNGTEEGDPAYEAGQFGDAINLDGDGDYVDLGNDPLFDFTDQITMMCWIKVNQADRDDLDAIISKGDGSYRMAWSRTDGMIEAAFGGLTVAGTNWGNITSSETRVDDGEWHHLATLFDGSSIYLYIDGVLNVSAGASGAIDVVGDNLMIGTAPDNLGRLFNGLIDDVAIFDEALSVEDIQNLMENGVGGGPSGKASSPKPTGEDVLRDGVVLSWKPGEFAYTHNLFFGDSLNDVNDATIDDPLCDIVEEGLALEETSYALGRLEYSKTYYWRVDEINAPPDTGKYTGDVWSFTVEDYSIQIPKENITVEAISSFDENDPNDTINESGLDPNYMDLHSNDTTHMWVSNGDDSDDVWIRYDFDKLYKLDKMLVWNYNMQFMNLGFKDVNVEYSEDGENWTALADVPQFAKAPGKNGYEYNTEVEFNGIAAKSVRLTDEAGWAGSGGDVYQGLSEVRFLYIPVRAREAKPVDVNDVAVNETLSWRSGREANSHEVYLSTDKQMVENEDGAALVDTATVNSSSPVLNFGSIYYWSVTEVNDLATPPRWPSGEAWRFQTLEYAPIEDFESYTDDKPDRIFDTWSDGYDIGDNGSQIGHKDPTYVETEIVQDGDQSAPVSYDNTGTAVNSEVARTFGAMDMTANGADTLRLYYHGQAPVESFIESSGKIVMTGLGEDLTSGNETDGYDEGYNFVYKTLSGNGSITVRIDTLGGGGNFAKAGIMIRDGLDDGALMTFACLEKSDAMYFRSREEAEGYTLSLNRGLNGETPIWIRLTRSGDTFTAMRSLDGDTWDPWGERGQGQQGGDPNVVVTETSDMSTQVKIGLFVSANSADVLAEGVFSNVDITGTVSGDWTQEYMGYDENDQLPGDNTPDILYFKITDSDDISATVSAPDGELAVLILDWVEWIIPYAELGDVDMSSVKEIAIGVGDSADPLYGEGRFFIDSISYGHPLPEDE